MPMFWNKKPANSLPSVFEVKLHDRYRFMYEGFLLSDQQSVYLFLENEGDVVRGLVFDRSTFKFGAPNDEALGGHPLARYGLGYYGLYEVKNSPWIRELCMSNRIHSRHSDKMYEGLRHFVVTFKDVTLEVVCRSYEEKRFPVSEIESLVAKQIDHLKQ
jgi:hypothetical protein